MSEKIPHKTTSRGRPKADGRDYKLEICYQIACGSRTVRIQEVLKEKFDMEIDRSSIDKTYRNKPRWQKLSMWIRQRMERKMLDIPIANKMLRLKRLEEVYNKSMILKTRRYSSVQVGEDEYEVKEIKERRLGEAIRALKEARVEVEGDKPLVKAENVNITQNNIFQDINVDGMPAVEIVKTLSNKLSSQHFKE